LLHCGRHPQLIVLLLICECIKFLSSKSLFTVSKKVTLDVLHILLGLETVSFPLVGVYYKSMYERKSINKLQMNIELKQIRVLI
jgi:hypothetical protein